MQALRDLIGRLGKVEREIYKVIASAIKADEAIILDMNATDQLFEKGINRDGVALSSFAPYRPVTIQIKGFKGQPTNRVTLQDTGDFHTSFFISYTADGFEIKASDWKTPKLLAGYGDEILGLSDQNFQDIAENYIKPEIQKYFKDLTL